MTSMSFFSEQRSLLSHEQGVQILENVIQSHLEKNPALVSTEAYLVLPIELIKKSLS